MGETHHTLDGLPKICRGFGNLINVTHALVRTSALQSQSALSLQARALAEFEGARSDLLAQLPAELPSKDVMDSLRPGGGPPDALPAPGDDEDQLVDNLVGLPWEFIINKDARQEWARMDRPFRSELHLELVLAAAQQQHSSSTAASLQRHSSSSSSRSSSSRSSSSTTASQQQPLKWLTSC